MSMVPAPHTFATKREASGWLAETVTDRKRGVWGVDPRPANAMTAARPGGGRQEAFTTAASVLRLHAALLPARRSESRSRHRPQRRPRVPITAPVGSTSGSTARDPAPSSLMWIPPVQLWARGDAAGVGVEIGFRSDEPEG